VLLHPEGVPAADQFVLSMANALALHDALSEYTDDVTIKWPNDIYWRDRKLCGTLIETTLQGAEIRDCLIGTGINVNQQRFVSDAPNPVSLRQILGRDVDRDTLLQRVLAYIAKYMEMVRDGRSEHIRTLYRSHLYRLDETHLYRFADGHEERCRLLNVTDDGYLELQSATNVLYRLAFKEVQFIIEH
jgi:BirA family biotin operon repressor/biotin-[acetyl-CoA-carboxylase] ligase